MSRAAEALDDVVVEVDVADLDAPEAARRLVELALDRRVDGEAVVVRGDLDAAGGLVEHRLVDAAVAEGQLVGAEAERAAEQLVAEADAEERQAVVAARPQQLDVVVGCRRGRRVRSRRTARPGRSRGRSSSGDRPAAATCTSKPRSARYSSVDCLDAEVEHGDGCRCARPSAGSVYVSVVETAPERFRPVISAPPSTSSSCSPCVSGAASPEKMPAAHGAGGADVAGDRARVDAADAHDAVADSRSASRLARRGSSRRRGRGRARCSPATQMRRGLRVLVVHAGVADVRRRHAATIWPAYDGSVRVSW